MKIPMLKSVLICGVCVGAISVPSPMALAQTTVERGENRVIVSVPMVPTPDKPIETGLAAVIKAKFPLSIAFGELGAGWRELNYRNNRYFTQGETTIVNETEYLVAYVYDSNAVDNLSAKAKASANAGEKEFIAGAYLQHEFDDAFRLRNCLKMVWSRCVSAFSSLQRHCYSGADAPTPNPKALSR